MWNFAAISKAISTATKAIGLYNLLKELFDSKDEVVEDKPKSNRKKPDRTLFTQYQFDYILNGYKELSSYNQANPSNKKNTTDLTNILNAHLGLDKSRTAYSRIWTGKIDRNNLPTGNPIEEYKDTQCEI